MKMGQNRNCKCGTFRRICTGSKFIKENQRTFIYFLKERDNIGHMRRECTKALLNTLFISDICINLMKYSQFTAVSGRNVKSGLSHQTEQADRFQRNSFTAGIWSGDDQQCELFSDRAVGDVPHGYGCVPLHSEAAGWRAWTLPEHLVQK